MVKQYIIERRIMHAIDSLRMNDFHLIKYDCNERAIAHRLAIYIEQIFNGEYSVDCEYNRDGVITSYSIHYTKLYENIPFGNYMIFH